MKGNCGECERRWFCDIDPNKCDEWPDPVPMTIAQKIRAMSDEELAEAAFRLAHSDDKPLSVQDMLERLQRPADQFRVATK